MQIKRLLLTGFMVTTLLSGCGRAGENTATNSETISTVADTYNEQKTEMQTDKTQTDKPQTDKMQTDKAQKDKPQENNAQTGRTQPDKAETDKSQTVTAGSQKYRGFLLDNILHSQSEGDIHYNVYIPYSYDGTKEYALYVTLPGYQNNTK